MKFSMSTKLQCKVADPDVNFHSNADPDSASKNNADPCKSGSATLVQRNCLTY
jgi:hypothetical protein